VLGICGPSTLLLSSCDVFALLLHASLVIVVVVSFMTPDLTLFALLLLLASMLYADASCDTVHYEYSSKSEI
jgi:hypothetical protein